MFHDLSRESRLNLGSKPKEMIPPECSLEKKWLFWITYRSNSKGSFIGTQTVYSQPQCYRVFSTQQLLTTLIYPWRKDFRSLHCLCSPSVPPPMDPSSGGLFLFNTAVFVSSLGGKRGKWEPWLFSKSHFLLLESILISSIFWEIAVFARCFNEISKYF